MDRMFLPVWILFYAVFTPILALKYTANLTYLCVMTLCENFLHIEFYPEFHFFSSYEGQQDVFAFAGFWLWGSILFPITYTVVATAALTYRLWRMLKDTVAMCDFLSKH